MTYCVYLGALDTSQISTGHNNCLQRCDLFRYNPVTPSVRPYCDLTATNF